MSTKLTLFVAAALSVGIIGCSHQKGWEVSGEIYGAEGSRLALEGFNNGSWYVVDSLEISKNGQFSYKAAEPAPYPEIMRLSLGDKYVYFPVDSVDRISLTSSAEKFGADYELTGTADAVSVRQLDSIVNGSLAVSGPDAVRADVQLKRDLFTRAMQAPTVMTAYYLINKSIGGKPYFNLSDRADVRLYGAVAQRFATERPDDPRTAYLREVFLRAQRNHRPSSVTTIEVPETALFEIARADESGKMQSLTEMASKGGVTVLSFTSFGSEASPAYNVLLNKVWEQYHSQGLNIYQISFDADETAWRTTARNLPWTTVWNGTTGGNEPLVRYNVGALPTTFIIDRSGSLAARVTDPTTLMQTVARYM